jgi:PAS domain S-box-containing protein
MWAPEPAVATLKEAWSSVVSQSETHSESFETTPAGAFQELATLAAHAARADLGWVSLVGQGLACASVSPGHDPQRLRALAQDSPLSGLVEPLVVLDAGGEPRFAAGVPLMAADGRVVGALCVADLAARARFDDTEVAALAALARLVMGQLRLQDLRRQHEAVLRAAGQVCFRTDAQGALVELSPSWTDLTGQDRSAALGRPLADLVSPADRVAVSAMLAPLGEGRSERLDCSLVRQSGPAIPVELAVGSLPDGLGASGAVGVLTDLRDRRRREMANGHDAKLEALGRLSAGIAHEINTPIQFVGDNTRFLAEAYEDMMQLLLTYRGCLDRSASEPPSQEQWELIAAAEQKADLAYLSAEVPSAVAQSLEGIERVASLVQAMKAFSYKDAVERSYADLNEALRTTCTVARNETKYVAEVILDLEEVPPLLCHIGDLNQVFLNLLVNAADALREQGEDLATGEIRVSTRVDGGDVVVTVADNAGGIPEEIQDKVFEPFFTTKEVGRGTGQGLALARAVVHDKHGGTITLCSELGKGSEFVIRLPLFGPGVVR